MTAESNGIAPTAPPRTAAILQEFYSTARAGQTRLSDGGGPFGFDITIALIADALIRGYHCDAICETGCHMGDTTSYLARAYPDLPIYTCDTDASAAAFTRRRVAGHGNVCVRLEDSPALVAQVCGDYERPLFYLDAHWRRPWPLRGELTAVQHGAGVVMVDDFDIGHPRFAFDEYDGIRCGADVLAGLPTPITSYWTNDPDADYPLPCLQVGRRSGVAVLPIGLGHGPLDQCPYLRSAPAPAIRS
jgi:hypothetical protein